MRRKTINLQGEKVKTKHIYLTIALAHCFVVSCNSQQAGEKKFAGKNQTASSDDLSQGNLEPLDISLGFDADSARNADGSPVDPNAELPSKGEGDPLTEEFALSCDDVGGMVIDIKPKGVKSDGKADKSLSITGDPEITATVSGKFCPVSKKTARKIMFIVDNSGSMGFLSTNDPETNGSCNRLEVAQTVFKGLADFTNVELSMIPFGGRVFEDKVIDFKSKKDFEDNLTAGYFCQSIDPNTGNSDTFTNYEAAFQKAEQMLSDIDGQKTIYFISDGEPTYSSRGQDPESAAQDGIAAGASLRKNIKNLTLNALLLGNVGDQAKQILVDIAGSDERVRESKLAGDLAEELADLPDVTIDNKSASATLLADPFGTHKLDLPTFSESNGDWTWKTRPFVLLGTEGKVVENIVEVQANGNNGETFQSKIVFRYQR